jgi:hypothetical protein
MAAERVHSETLQQKLHLEERVLQLSLQGSMQKSDAQRENESAIERIDSLMLESRQAKQTSEAYAAELSALSQQLCGTQAENTRLKQEIEEAKVIVASFSVTIAMERERHETLIKTAQIDEISLIRLVLVTVLLRQESKMMSTEIQKLKRKIEALFEKNANYAATFPKGVGGTREMIEDTAVWPGRVQGEEGETQQQVTCRHQLM